MKKTINFALLLNEFEWEKPKRVRSKDRHTEYILEGPFENTGPISYVVYKEFIKLDLDNLESYQDVQDFLESHGSLIKNRETDDDGLESETIKLNYLLRQQNNLKALENIEKHKDKKDIEALENILDKNNIPQLEGIFLEGVFTSKLACKPKELIDYLRLIGYLRNRTHITEILCRADYCKEFVGSIIGNKSNQIYCEKHKHVPGHVKKEAIKNYYKEVYGDNWKVKMKEGTLVAKPEDFDIMTDKQKGTK